MNLVSSLARIFSPLEANLSPLLFSKIFLLFDRFKCRVLCFAPSPPVCPHKIEVYVAQRASRPPYCPHLNRSSCTHMVVAFPHHRTPLGSWFAHLLTISDLLASSGAHDPKEQAREKARELEDLRRREDEAVERLANEALQVGTLAPLLLLLRRGARRMLGLFSDRIAVNERQTQWSTSRRMDQVGFPRLSRHSHRLLVGPLSSSL